MSTSTGRDSSETGATLRSDGRPVYDRGDTVCVIGAGASGLTAIKNLREHGFGVDCYERETSVGGAWNWRHDRSPVYASTHLISSKPFTQFPDFPMPDSWPDYPHHSQLLSYLERYADHFELRPHVWFGTEVVRVEPADGGRWDVTTRSTGGYGAERIQRYAAVVVANGHNWSPKMPGVRGTRRLPGPGDPRVGVQGPDPAARQAGAGDRGRQHRLRHRGRGRPAGHPVLALDPTRLLVRPQVRPRPPGRPGQRPVLALRLPLRLRQWLCRRTLRLTVGDLTRFGLPQPGPQGLRDATRSSNSQLVYYLGPRRGSRPVPDVTRFRWPHAWSSTDGQEIEPDLVVLATGYLPRFEFLDPGAARRRRRRAARRSTCTRSRAVTRRWRWSACCRPTPGCSRWCTGRRWRSPGWLRLRETAPDRASAVRRPGRRRPVAGGTRRR